MSKNQYWSGGNWNSMVPGGQGTAYNASTAGFKASFTKTVIVTGVSNLESSLKISGNNGKISACFDGNANVELYSASGQLIKSTKCNNEFSENVKSGMYLIRVNGKTHKVIVN